MTNIVTLGGGQASIAMQPNQDVIKALEQMLDDAKAGRIQHIIAIHSDGKSMPFDLYQGSGEPWQVAALLGAMDLCKFTILTEWFRETPIERPG